MLMVNKKFNIYVKGIYYSFLLKHLIEVGRHPSIRKVVTWWTRN